MCTSTNGHLCRCRSTNYKKWFSSPEPYPIRFKSGYEPYVLVARKIMPWYDERFRGYGWDKVRITHDLVPQRYVQTALLAARVVYSLYIMECSRLA